MTYITTALTIIVTLVKCSSPSPEGDSNDFSSSYIKEYTRNVTLKQGSLQGIVVASRINRRLPPVEQYKGIPYAAPPVGELRFMPSGSAPSWFGMKYADTFKPVCPQKFPETKAMTTERREEFFRLRKYLMNQSEDCLYLNIYAPHQGSGRSTRKYPVMVYIHGESFEWNSGNPYDGSILAAYGKVIVVTLNYRLGVLGFLRAGTEEYSKSNFGLIDQIAALLWVKDNIAAFGGDPDAVTLFGHGTGAVCASLLMLSPMILHGNKMLFQRAILMSGSALSDWALAGNPREVTYHVAQALNCQIHDDFAACLRRKRLNEIMAAAAVAWPYKTRFGPVVDSVVVPNDPKKLMTTYTDIFRRFEMMYGVTELESINLLGADALKLGILEKDRDLELRRYLRSRCEIKPELCVTRTLAEYSSPEFSLMDDERYMGFTGHEPDRASLARDALLDILSDARSVAPVVQMAKYHATLNPQSYFYVFTHKTHSKEYIRDKSYFGEELPYVFGVPLGGPKFHFTDHYTEKERLFSEIMMTYFCNFAYTGDPNVPRRNEYYSLDPNDWVQFEVDWPEYDLKQQQYLQLGIPPYIMSHYRDEKIRFWNEVFPELLNNHTDDVSPKHPIKSIPPWILTHPVKSTTYNNKFENFHKPYNPPRDTIYGKIKISGTTAPDNMVDNVVYGSVIDSPSMKSGGISTSTTIAILISLLLFFNICLFLFIYLKKYRKRKIRIQDVQKQDEPTINSDDVNDKSAKTIANGCGIMRFVSKSSRSEDTYEAVKSSGSNSKNKKLPRQMSSSTIDAHTKVRDWITNEIVYKYSPRYLRRNRHGKHDKKVAEIKSQEQGCIETSPLNDSNSTLGRSPTRPVTPSENLSTKTRPPLIKSSSIPVQHKKNKVEKVSVAIDATPSARSNSVLAQQPIELTKSLDRPNFESTLRRSATLEDFSPLSTESDYTNKQELRKSTTSINLMVPQGPTVIKIEHSHSKSEPVQDIYAQNVKKLKTFDPHADVNVTSRDDNEIQAVPLTPEESLMTIKRRNFPKVLPDYPSREALIKKRRSMPVANHLFLPIPEIPAVSQPNSPTGKTFVNNKFPPAPPVRTTSTLTRRPVATNQQNVCQSEPMLAQEPPPSPEPEVACNNLYFGPLVPKLQSKELSASESSKLNTQPIYESLRSKDVEDLRKTRNLPKTIITTDPNQPIKKVDGKVIIKPTMTRSISDPKKNIPRVVVKDNIPEAVDVAKKPSLIPTLLKSSKDSSSSDSSPSDASDTGTVVKRL